MTLSPPPRLAALLLLWAACTAGAQSTAPPVAASVPATITPPPPATGQPRLLTPGEQREVSAAPGELRPAAAVTQQINIPLGKKPAAETPAAPAPRAGAASASVLDDAAARCQALRGKQARASCHERLAHQAPKR